MNVTLSGQLYEFGIALLMGVSFGILYDVFKVLRLIGLDFKVAVFIEDLLFFLIATVTVFSYYMQITDGKFRIFPLISALLGFILYSITLEKLVFFVICKIYKLISKLFKFIYYKIFLFAFKKILSLLKIILGPAVNFIKKYFAENIVNFFKNLLPKKGRMLYNNKGNFKGKRGKGNNGSYYC